MTMHPAADDIWQQIRREVTQDAAKEPGLAGFLHNAVLSQPSLECSLSYLLAGKLESSAVTALDLQELLKGAFMTSETIQTAVREDLRAVVTRDPAAQTRYSTPLLYFKGFNALQAYRASHWYWLQGRPALALFLQSRISTVFAVDIHPAARLGKGMLFDHATSVVIGETAVVEDDVSMLHEVTLGGTGKESGDRHPKIKRGVMIGAGAKVLGNITVGEGAKIAAGSVVLHDVPPHVTVAGVPAKPVNVPASLYPSLDMDQYFDGGPLAAAHQG